MTLSLNIRRTVMLGLALLLFLAVAGPACLLAATEAMGMPMGSDVSAPADCGDNGEGPSMACPHSNPVEVTADSGRTVAMPLGIVFTAPDVAPSVLMSGRVIPRAERYSSTPPSHVTPLRL